MGYTDGYELTGFYIAAQENEWRKEDFSGSKEDGHTSPLPQSTHICFAEAPAGDDSVQHWMF